MGVSRQQLIAMVLLVVLPLCVAAITALGLWNLERSQEHVAEEYQEVRLLHPIDRDLSNAILALESSDPNLHAMARHLLENAQAALIKYLATQFDDIAEEEHQALESGEASDLLNRLRDALDLDPASLPAHVADVTKIREGLALLQSAADTGVNSAQDDAHASRRSTLSWVIVASLVCAFLCIAFLTWSTRSVNRRLHDLRERLAAQATGPVPKPAREIGGVVTQIEELNSRMIEKIEESGRELLRRERLAGIGLLAADVAHEINNPMNAMLGLSELGLQTVEKGPIDEAARAELAESLRVVRREALRCKAIVARLMAMVRSDRKPTWFDAAHLIQETIQVAQAARPDRASCYINACDGLSVATFAPANDVRQILLTLLINAADAVQTTGRIEVDATRTEKEIWLRVRDNGRGFTEAMRQTFFTPFHSYSEDGRGMGLGLSIAQALAESMGATLRAFSDGPGSGSTFILALPLKEETP